MKNKSKLFLNFFLVAALLVSSLVVHMPVPVSVSVSAFTVDVDGTWGAASKPNAYKNWIGDGTTRYSPTAQDIYNVQYTGTLYNGSSYNSQNPPVDRGSYQASGTWSGYPPMTITGTFVIVYYGSGTLTMESWNEGETPKNPVLTNNTNTNVTPTYMYNGRDGTEYSSSEKPTKAGKYTVTATVQNDKALYYLGYDRTVNFEIYEQYTIQFMDGSDIFNYWKSDYTPPETYAPGQTVDLPTVDNIDAPEGKIFDGWYEDPEFTGDRITSIPASDTITDKIYYVKWIDDPLVTMNYKVSDQKMGTVTQSTETIHSISGTAQGATATPNRGYAFVNWTDDATGQEVDDGDGDPYTFTPQKVDGVYQSANYTANFELDDTLVTINYKVSDESMASIDRSTETVYAITGTAKGATVTVRHAGFRLVSWTDDATGQQVYDSDNLPSTLTPPKVNGAYQNASYTANIVADNYKVSFNANGGSGTMEEQTFTYGIQGNLIPNTLTQENYIFKGWNTQPDGTGMPLDDQGVVLDIPIELMMNYNDIMPYVLQHVTLYAQWEEAQTYTVSYDVAEDPVYGSPSDVTIPETQNVLPNSSVTLAAALTTSETIVNGIPGTWTFTGWSRSIDYSDIITEISDITADTQVYGKWTFTPSGYTLNITKINAGSQPLQGAGFILYSDDACTEIANVYIDPEQKNSIRTVTDDLLRTDAEGVLTFYGLVPGNYWLKEIITPSGYAILESPISIQILTDGSVTVSGVDKTPSAGIYEINLEVTDNALILDIPSTGFGGVIPFVILGIFLILGSTIVLEVYSYRRKRQK